MLRPIRLAVLLALVVAASTALVACGSDNERILKNAYVEQVNSAQTEFVQTVRTADSRITQRSTWSENRRTLQRFQKAISDVVKRLRAIKAPSDVKTEHESLVAAMSTFGAQIKKATSTFGNPDIQAAQEAQTTIRNATRTVNTQVNSAIAAINSKLSKK